MSFLAFDCEGPITLNDNALEFTAYLLPKGDYFFTQLSRFDDYLADIKKRPFYKAGDTLKLILPFLRLYGASNQLLKEFSEKTLLILPEVEKVFPSLNKLAPTFIISTSYRPYLLALAQRLDFPMENIFGTEVDLDKIKISPAEKKILEKLYEEILNLPLIELPKSAKTPEDLPQDLLSALDRLERIFFEIIWNLDCGIFLREVNPIGGEEKAKVCQEISQRLNVELSKGFYCGDSITDCQALELLKENGGISLSFNGNRYALRSAEFYALSKDSSLFLNLGKLFLSEGKEGLENFKKNLKEGYEFSKIPEDSEEFWKLVEKSEDFRKKVRGALIGSLG